MLLSYTEETATGYYLKHEEFSTHPQILPLWFILILSSHLLLESSSDILPSYFPTQDFNKCMLRVPPIHRPYVPNNIIHAHLLRIWICRYKNIVKYKYHAVKSIKLYFLLCKGFGYWNLCDYQFPVWSLNGVIPDVKSVTRREPSHLLGLSWQRNYYTSMRRGGNATNTNQIILNLSTV
jgi:hypothetical protein